MIYKPKHFSIDEYIYPELYHEYKAKNQLWKLNQSMDERVLITNDRIREFVNTSVTINDYRWGGIFTESGLRPFGTDTGSSLSTHKYGRASDLKFYSKQWTPEKLRNHMKDIGCFEPGFKQRTDKEAYPFVLINRIEWPTNKIMSWFHYDVSSLGPGDGSIGIIRVKL